MKSDWYRMKKPGTYLVVRAGSSTAPAMADSRLSGYINECDERPFIRHMDAHAIAEVIGVLGIDDCLKLRGYCIVRSSALLESLRTRGLGASHDDDAVQSSESP